MSKMPVMKQEPHPLHEGGIMRTYQFKHYKLSAIKTDFSYGGKDGLWEIAVMDKTGAFVTRDIWHDLYDDVIGHVTNGQLQKYLEDVNHWDLETEQETEDGL